MDQSIPALLDIDFNLEGTNYADLVNPDEDMLTIDWADWDEFVHDAEGGPDPILQAIAAEEHFESIQTAMLSYF